MILKKKNCTETLLLILAKEFALSKVDEPRKSPFKKKNLKRKYLVGQCPLIWYLRYFKI